MRLLDLAALYVLVGVVCAAAAWRQRPARPSLADLALTLLAWPIYVPFLLSDTQHGSEPAPGRCPGEYTRLVAALGAVRDPTLISLLPTAQQLAPLAEQLRRLDAKVSELDEVLDRERAEGSGTPRASAADGHARLVQESLAQLESLRSRAEREREELLALCGRLRMQVTVLRFAGRAPEDVGALVSQILARIEGVGAAFEGDIAAASEPPAAVAPSAAPSPRGAGSRRAGPAAHGS